MIGAATVAGWVAALSCGLLWLRERRCVAELQGGVLDAIHELSRPLTALRMAFAAPRFAGFSATLDSEVERAAASLAELSRVAGVAVPLRLDSFDLGQLVHQIADLWQAAAEATGRTLTAEVTGSPAVVGDRGRIGQAVENLVANALEHGTGAVRLVVTEAGGRCMVEVVDRGGRVVVGEPGAVAPSVGRGRGLNIASQIAAVGGGRLDRERVASGRVLIELPTAGAVL